MRPKHSVKCAGGHPTENCKTGFFNILKNFCMPTFQCPSFAENNRTYAHRERARCSSADESRTRYRSRIRSPSGSPTVGSARRLVGYQVANGSDSHRDRADRATCAEFTSDTPFHHMLINRTSIDDIGEESACVKCVTRVRGSPLSCDGPDKTHRASP